MKFPGFIPLLFLATAAAFAQPYPADSVMATTAKAFKKAPLNPTEKPDDVTPGGHAISDTAAAPFITEPPPSGGAALLFTGNSDQAIAGRGEFIIAPALPAKTRYIGAWFYLGGESNVKELGFVFHEKASGEFLGVTWPADFIGWKWLEVDLTDTTLVLANPHFEANGLLDEPLDRVTIIWQTSGEGASSLAVSGITTASE